MLVGENGAIALGLRVLPGLGGTIVVGCRWNVVDDVVGTGNDGTKG